MASKDTSKSREFNLGKKRYSSYDGIDENGIAEKLSWHYLEEDVKEAIRLIKLNPDKIDEIVGEKLKWSQESNNLK